MIGGIHFRLIVLKTYLLAKHNFLMQLVSSITSIGYRCSTLLILHSFPEENFTYCFTFFLAKDFTDSQTNGYLSVGCPTWSKNCFEVSQFKVIKLCEIFLYNLPILHYCSKSIMHMISIFCFVGTKHTCCFNDYWKFPKQLALLLIYLL